MTTRPTIQAIVFDLDDTLYPEVQFVQSGYRAVAERFADRLGPPEATLADLLAIFDSPDRSRAFNALLEHRSLPDDAELIKAMVATYRTHAPALTLHADAAAVLDRLTGRYPLGLITDGPLATQRAKFDALPLGSRFAAVVFTDELGPGRAKPPGVAEQPGQAAPRRLRARRRAAAGPARTLRVRRRQPGEGLPLAQPAELATPLLDATACGSGRLG